MSSQPPDPASGEAIPLSEQGANANYDLSQQAAAPTQQTTQPADPVGPSAADSPSLQGTVVPNSSIDNNMLVVPAPAGSPEGIGGVLLTDEAMLNDPNVRGAMDNMGTPPRAASRELFKPEPDQVPSDELVKQFVTNQRLRDLWNQIDALQEEVIQNVVANRTNTDTYQQDLLYASSLLLQSASHYDEAREILYRVRGDLNRERKVSKDTSRYRPLLMAYYGLWFLLVVLISRFDPQFRQLMPDSLPILKLAFPPILFAVLGSLFNGVMALNQHTSNTRDFDPIYSSWYFINPIVGGLLGLVVFVFFVVTGTSFTPNLVSDPNVSTTQAPLAIWLLAFIVGWQQNTAVSLLNGFLKTVSPSTPATPPPDRPSLTPPSASPPAPPK